MSTDLTKILPPPKKPTKGAGIQWADAERFLGIALPAEYKSFIDTYGEGKIDGFLTIYSPLGVDFGPRLVSALGAASATRAGLPDDFPFPLFPEEGGLLPCGQTDNGDLVWLRPAHAESWTVVVTEASGPERDEFAGTLTEFLARVLTKEHTSPVFPGSFPAKKHAFTPAVHKRVVRVHLEPSSRPFADRGADLVGRFKKTKVKAQRSSDLAFDVTGTTLSIQYRELNAAIDGEDGSELSLIFEQPDELKLRAILRTFLGEQTLKVRRAADFAQNPVWPEGV
jgi:hypothetical protein